MLLAVNPVIGTSLRVFILAKNNKNNSDIDSEDAENTSCVSYLVKQALVDVLSLPEDLPGYGPHPLVHDPEAGPAAWHRHCRRRLAALLKPRPHAAATGTAAARGRSQ